MKKTSLSIKLIMIAVTSYCQVNNIKSYEISPLKTILNDCNFVYCSNIKLFRYLPYTFYIDTIDACNIIVEGRNIKIERLSENIFDMYIYDSIKNVGQLIFSRLNEGRKTEICKRYIQIYELPITVMLANKKSGSMIKYEELKNGSLAASIVNYDIELKFEVKSFKVALVLNDSLIEMEGIGDRLNTEQLMLISQINNNCPIVFKNISIKKLDGAMIGLDPIIYFLDKSN